LIDGAVAFAGCGQIMGQEFGLALDEIGEVLVQRGCDTDVQFLPSGTE
jgi:hypothetical protein